MSMRSLPLILLAIFGSLFTFHLFGQSLPPVNTDAPSMSDWWALYQALGKASGLSVLGIVALVVQALVLAARSQFDPLPGPMKLLVITGLTLLGGIVGMKASTDLSWVAILMNSTVLTAIQVFFNQWYKQIFQGSIVPK